MTLEIKGARLLQKDLESTAARVRKPPGMRQAAGAMVEIFRRNIQSAALGSFKPLAKATIRERIRKGFGAGPPLVRTGSLGESLRIVAVTADGAVVGIEGDKRAAALDQVRPFIGFTEADAESLTKPIFDRMFP